MTADHGRILDQEMTGREIPHRLQVPTMTPCMTVLLDFGTEEQKQRHVAAILRGDEIWMQMLSEPGGGSDVAGAQTSAVRDGDEWVLNGSKVWTTGAWWADWGPCLARTNWDVPKHRGLTVFMVTHDLDSLRAICDRIAVLIDKRILVDTMEALRLLDHPWVREYFHGPRGRAALAAGV